MYSELIYTRCGEGIDILRGRNPIKNSGFKVFSCSENITEAGLADLPFLYAAAQSKEPYVDPTFMDDAYLFFVPDRGENYLLNFHPIPFDRTATGDYSHRPGNFINQIFVGRFDDLYPYELFGNESVWDAQKRGEAFYYENAPTPLPQRDNLNETIGYISFDDIAAFVADGRREVLMKAIAFIVAQYSLPPEERKFLVIRDENSRNIELWIAAIESAFSPRMAAGLSFATRLDKFANANKYTVNLDGQYQTQINLQSPNQKLRFRAMIVGVDERDKSNSSAAKALANSPYVLLDGKAKTISVNVDASNPYYRYVTAYNDGHMYLCREFMQMVDATSPSEDALKLYSAYSSLVKFSTSKKLKDLIPAITILDKFKLIRTTNLEKLYKEIKQEIPTFLREDAVLSFAVMNWLERTSAVVGDSTVRASFKDIICTSYADNVFVRPQTETTRELDKAIRKSAFLLDASENLLSLATVESYMSVVQSYKPEEWTAFSEYFAEALKLHKGNLPESVKSILPESINSLYRATDGKKALKVASLYIALNQKQTVEILLDNASKSADQRYTGFIIQLLCIAVPEIVASEASLARFYEQLQMYNLGHYISTALAYKAQTVTRPQDIDRFLEWTLSDKKFKEVDMSPVFKVLDKNLVLSDKTAGRVAAKIQRYKPENVSCINSAHIYALDVLDDRKLANDAVSILRGLISQGFPSIKDDTYCIRLIDRLFDSKLSDEAFAAIVSAAANSSFYSNMIANEAMRYVGTRQDSVIGEIVEIATRINSKAMFDALVTACSEIRQFDKGMTAIRGTISSKPAQQYFALIEMDARKLHGQKRDSSPFGRLFSRGFSDDSDSGSWGKK